MFDPTEPVETTSEVLSAYAQDRFDLTDRFVLYVGVRMDDQAFDNDAGTEVNSSTDFAPRLGATFDLDGEGTMLLKASAGRYYQVTGQDIFNREYATKPNGTNQFTQFGWNPATLAYDIRQQSTVPVLGFNPGSFDPYYKDEVSLGYEWQFMPAWAFEARANWWEVDDTFWTTDQWNATGQVVRDVRNWDDGFREYEGAPAPAQSRDAQQLDAAHQLHLRREQRQQLRQRRRHHRRRRPVRRPGRRRAQHHQHHYNTANREGRGNTDREHNLNVVGLKVFPVGDQERHRARRLLRLPQR